MKTLDTRKLVLCIIAFVIAVFMLSMLAFPLVSASYKAYDSYGKLEDSEKETLTGFDMLDSLSESKDEDSEDDNEFSYIASIVGNMTGYIPSVISCFQIIFACLAIVATVLAIFLFNKNATNVVCKVTVILGIVFSLLYLLRGWAYHLSYDNTSWDKTSVSIVVETASHVPFIIIGLLSIAYAFCAHLVPEKEIKLRRPTKEVLTPAMVEQQKMDTLRKYKELFDNGVISEEEFISIKRKLLG
ncbi:MAG: SHOCT domain-containing protein [Clostridia bacterium]|nr:SHOCT domain-containing protein [Clostridia bacterium]